MIASVVVRLLVIAVLWFAATEAGPSALGYGLVAVPLVAAATYAVLPRRRLALEGSLARRVGGILSVIPLAGWVLWRSVVGGVDVARRALWLPRPDIAPAWSVYETTLRTRSARVALALVMNLMPGSLSASLDGTRLDVHVIDPDLDVHAAIAALERRLARIEGSARA